MTKTGQPKDEEIRYFCQNEDMEQLLFVIQAKQHNSCLLQL